MSKSDSSFTKATASVAIRYRENRRPSSALLAKCRNRSKHLKQSGGDCKEKRLPYKLSKQHIVPDQIQNLVPRVGRFTSNTKESLTYDAGKTEFRELNALKNAIVEPCLIVGELAQSDA